jgi:predicted RNase H-like HicB family nuclease
MIYKYKVVLHESEEGIAVSCPALPGCWSQGENEKDALANIRDAIHEYFLAVEDLTCDGYVREVEVAA